MAGTLAGRLIIGSALSGGRAPGVVHGQLLQALSTGVAEDGSRMQCRTQFRADMMSAVMRLYAPYSTFLVPLEADEMLAVAARGGGLAWSAPELLTATEMRFTAATDVYALGVTMWEVVTRRVPFRGHGHGLCWSCQ